MKTHTKTLLAAFTACAALAAGPADAANVLSEDFELADVATTAQQFPDATSTIWLSNQSFNGFRKYIWDESHTLLAGDGGSAPAGSTFSTSNGDQAFIISGYSSAVGMTTKEGVLGTYDDEGTATLNFLMGSPSAQAGASQVNVKLYAFNQATTSDGDRDNQAQQNPGGTANVDWVLLKQETFSSTSSALEAKVFSVTLDDPTTVGPDVTGWDLALRVHGGDFNYGIIDDLQLDITLVPEPSSLALLGLGGLLIARRRRG